MLWPGSIANQNIKRFCWFTGKKYINGFSRLLVLFGGFTRLNVKIFLDIKTDRMSDSFEQMVTRTLNCSLHMDAVT